MRFNLRDIGWLILAICVGFGAYRWGFQAGRDYRDPIVITTRAYSLPFTLNGNGGDLLCKLVRETIEPDTWIDVVPDAEGSIVYSPETNSLIVRNQNQIHDRIADLIKELNRFEDPKNKSLPGAVQSVQVFLMDNVH